MRMLQQQLPSQKKPADEASSSAAISSEKTLVDQYFGKRCPVDANEKYNAINRVRLNLFGYLLSLHVNNPIKYGQSVIRVFLSNSYRLLFALFEM